MSKMTTDQRRAIRDAMAEVEVLLRRINVSLRHDSRDNIVDCADGLIEEATRIKQAVYRIEEEGER